MWGLTKIEDAGLAENSLTVTCTYKFGHIFFRRAVYITTSGSSWSSTVLYSIKSILRVCQCLSDERSQWHHHVQDLPEMLILSLTGRQPSGIPVSGECYLTGN